MEHTSTIPPGSCATGSPQAGPCSAPSSTTSAPNRGTAHPSVFAPPPESIPFILEQLADSSLSLLDIARKHNLSLDALAALLTRPDIAERLDELHILAAQRARLVASQHLAAAATALASILHTGNDRAESAPLDPTNPRHLALRLRQRESTRRAATTLLRIAHYTPRSIALVGRTSRPPAPASLPRDTQVRGSASTSVLSPALASGAGSRSGGAEPPAPSARPSPVPSPQSPEPSSPAFVSGFGGAAVPSVLPSLVPRPRSPMPSSPASTLLARSGLPPPRGHNTS